MADQNNREALKSTLEFRGNIAEGRQGKDWTTPGRGSGVLVTSPFPHLPPDLEGSRKVSNLLSSLDENRKYHDRHLR